MTDFSGTKTNKCLGELTGTNKTDRSCMNESTRDIISCMNEPRCTKPDSRMNENVWTKGYDSMNELRLTKGYESRNEKTANWSTNSDMSRHADTSFNMFTEEYTTRKGDTRINMPYTDEGLMTKEPPDNALLKAKKKEEEEETMEIPRSDSRFKKKALPKETPQDTAGEGDKEEETKEEEDSTEYPDGGWGYVVLASLVFTMVSPD